MRSREAHKPEKKSKGLGKVETCCSVSVSVSVSWVTEQAYCPLFVLCTCASFILMALRLRTKDFVNTIITAI